MMRLVEIAQRLAEYEKAGLPDNPTLWKHAHVMDQMHKDHDHEHYDTSPRREMKGLVGERRFAFVTGLPLKLRYLLGGDDHVDQWLRFEKGVVAGDVKCAVYAKELIVPVSVIEKLLREHPERRTVFILAELLYPGIDWETSDPLTWDAELLKWNWERVLRRSIPKYHRADRRILNYWCARKECRDLNELFDLMLREDRVA